MSSFINHYKQKAKKKTVMQNPLAPCLVFVAWIVFFRFALEASGAPLDSKGTDLDLHIEAVKTAMLEYLGMENTPESREKASHTDLKRLYHQYRRLRGNVSSVHRDSHLIFPTTVHHLNPKQSWTGSTNPKIHWFRYVFHKDSYTTDAFTLAQAKLQLQPQPFDIGQILVRIHKLSQSYTEKVFSTEVMNGQGRKLKVNVTKEVEKWLWHTNEMLLTVDIGLVMRKKLKPNAKPQMFLELEVLLRNTRKARSANEDVFEDESNCRRKSLSVSFEEIGWSDWIVAPTAYTMYFCDGFCPHNYKPASMHTQIKSRLHRLTKGETPRPCCVPAAYEPMILMHYDGRGKLKLSSFNDLIVTKCHCA